jgi:glycosyltransferase involved in cell wall biosynthesis
MPFLQDLPGCLVADVYVPIAAESLAWNATKEPTRQEEAYRLSWEVTRAVAQHTDFLICPGERQRDYWLGVLSAHGRLRQELYAADPDLRNLLDIVPFGCPADPPAPEPALKGHLPGIASDDRVILWGSGIWNWFDPITLLEAMPQVIERHPDARLVFMGADHPDTELIPEMERARQARALSRDLGLEGEWVFWVPWVAYADRGAYLLDADVGVSLHRLGVETRLAFRTRLLDAIWAELPMVLTRGDVLAEEFEQLGLGHAVDAGDVDQVAWALDAILSEVEPRASRQAAFDELKLKYDWARATEPLKEYCRDPYKGTGKDEAIRMAEGNRAQTEATLQAEIDRLRSIVQGYESGLVMRFLKSLHSLRTRLLGE